jgi:LPXTG-motif cell wall-anchored protein
MIKTFVRLAVACALTTFVSVSSAHAQPNNDHNRTTLTFSQPVEVPGKVLPAGTYVFEHHEAAANRHIVNIYEKDGKKLITSVLAVPDYRLKATSKTVINFAEVGPGQPQAIKAWFFPGTTVGDELVYSKTRAQALAVASNVMVPAMDDTNYTEPKPDTMKDANVVVMTPEKKEEPISAIQTTPIMPPPETKPVEKPVEPATPAREELPHTASNQPLIAWLGFAILAVGFSLLRMASSRPSR